MTQDEGRHQDAQAGPAGVLEEDEAERTEYFTVRAVAEIGDDKQPPGVRLVLSCEPDADFKRFWDAAGDPWTLYDPRGSHCVWQHLDGFRFPAQIEVTWQAGSTGPSWRFHLPSRPARWSDISAPTTAADSIPLRDLPGRFATKRRRVRFWTKHIGGVYLEMLRVFESHPPFLCIRELVELMTDEDPVQVFHVLTNLKSHGLASQGWLTGCPGSVVYGLTPIGRGVVEDHKEATNDR